MTLINIICILLMAQIRLCQGSVVSDLPAGRDPHSVYGYYSHPRSQIPYERQIYPTRQRQITRNQRYSVDMKIPGATSESSDKYFCVMNSLSDGDQFLMDVSPLAYSSPAHHITLYGCEYSSIETQPEPLEYWDCGGNYATCAGESKILFSWSPKVEKLHFPSGVGFPLGDAVKINLLVLQVHYDAALLTPDYSGVSLVLTRTPPPRIADFYLLYSSKAVIPAKSQNVHVDIACLFQGRAPLTPFAFRVHAHDLGRAVSAYRIREGVWTLLGVGDPRQPQSFFPIKSNDVEIQSGDYLAARCTYDNPGSVDVHIGGDSGQEMCNFYLMYWIEAREARVAGGGMNGRCDASASDHFSANFPHDADTSGTSSSSLSRSASDEKLQADERVVPTETPKDPVPMPQPRFAKDIRVPGLGQVGGLATDSAGRLVIFHRGSRTWDGNSFSLTNRFNPRLPAIPDNTLALVDTIDGVNRVSQEWGRHLFYMPHGLTIDGRGRLWLTDVGTHQVYRFTEMGNETADLTLGVKKIPGNDRRHFCKPTDVAVMADGTFFVADGYCNSRVIRFDANGNFQRQWGQSPAGSGPQPPPLAFFVPHGLALDEKRGLLCIADRENGRIQITDLTGKFKYSVNSRSFNRLFAVEYSPVNDVLYAVNGPAMSPGSHVMGFSISMRDFRILNKWNRHGRDFDQPHDVTVNPDGKFVYVGEIGPNRVSSFAVVQVEATSETDSRELNFSVRGEDDDDDDEISRRNSATAVSSSLTATAMIVGVLVIVSGSFLVAIQRCGGVNLRQLTRIGFDRIVGAATKTTGGSGHKASSGPYHPMGDGFSLSSGLNLGTLLNRRQGFDRLGTDEGELESLSQDLSDAEYEATGETTELNT